MEMFFLILHYGSSSINAMAVMPQSYPKEQCEKLAAGYSGMQGKCIPAPVAKIADDYRYERAKIEYCLAYPEGSLAKEYCK